MIGALAVTMDMCRPPRLTVGAAAFEDDSRRPPVTGVAR